MLKPRRVEIDVQPQAIEKLGNGTYYYNYDIQSKQVTITDEEGQKKETRWTYIQTHLRGVPSYTACVQGIIRQFVTAEDELSLINKYNAYQMGAINDSSICAEYQEYVGLVSSIKSSVKKDFDMEEVDTKYDLLPTQADIINLLKILVSTTTLTDAQALSCKSLYPTWESCIGKPLKVDDKVTYNGNLYKVIQTISIVLEHQTPDLVPANYALIEASHAGTKEDPIPYEQMMLIEKDKYYIQYGKIYIGIMNANTGFPYDLKDLPTLVLEVIE